MKLSTGDGAYIEARETFQYHVITDRWLLRYDAKVGNDRIMTFGREDALNASDPKELRAQLNEQRIQCGASMAESIRALGKDYSEAEALPMPSGLVTPDWAR